MNSLAEDSSTSIHVTPSNSDSEYWRGTLSRSLSISKTFDMVTLIEGQSEF